MKRLAAGTAAIAVLAFAGTMPAHAAPDTPGAYCETAGAQSETKNGVKLECSQQPGEQQPRWREVPGGTLTASPSATPKTPTPTPGKVTPKPNTPAPSPTPGGLAKTGV